MIIMLATPAFGRDDGARLVQTAAKWLEQGRRDSALVELSQVVGRYYENPGDKTGHLQTVQAMQMLARLYMYEYYDYNKSYEYLATAIAIAEDEEMDRELPNLYDTMAAQWNLSYLTSSKGREQTVAYAKKAWRAAIDTGQPELVLDWVVNLCSIDLGEARPSFVEELSEFRRIRFQGDHPEVAYDNAYIDATFAANRGDHRTAAALYRKARKLAEPIPRAERYVMSAINAEGHVYKFAGDMRQATDAWRTGLGIAQQAGMLDWEMSFATNLADIFQAGGMPDSADVYRYRSLLLNQQMRDACHLPDIHERELQVQIERVNTENRQLSVIRAKRERQMVWIAAAAMVVLLCGLLAAWRYRSVQTKNRELFQKHQELMDSYRLLNDQIVREARTEAPAPDKDAGGKYANSPLDTSTSEDIYNRVLRQLETNDEVFQPGFNIDRMAELVGFKSRLVSQAINEKSGRSFSQILSQRRIREAATRLADQTHWGQYTVEAVALSVGLQSLSTFSKAFKASTGLTPSEYRKMGQPC